MTNAYGKHRLVVATLLLVSALGLVAPALVGFLVEARYRDLAAQRGVVDMDFQRGWFGSRARWRLRLPDLPPLSIVDRIRHGPLLFDGLALARVTSRAQGPASGRGALEATTRVAWNGEADARLSWPGPLRLRGFGTLRDGVLDVRFDAALSYLVAHARAARLDLEDGVSGLREAVIGLALRRSGKLWGGELQARAAELAIESRRATAVELRATLARVDPYRLGALPALLADPGSGLFGQLARLRLAAQILPPLLSSAPRLSIQRFHFDDEAGEVSLSGHLGVDPGWAGDRSLLRVPLYLDAALDGELPVRLARAWIMAWLARRGARGADADEVLKTLARGGWLERNADRVRVRARAQDGILELNGKSLPLSGLLFGS